MTGGLIQLVTTGIQDSPLIGNPEITFFKTVYRQHTMFSLCQSDRFIGKLKFEKEGSKVLEKNGDLLYNQYFKIEIPFFDIIKNITTKEIVEDKYDINFLETTYANLHCYVIYSNNNWYIVPENLFKLSSFNNVLYEIDSSLMVPNLLPEYIQVFNIGQHAYFYQIEDNKVSSIINILRITTNMWEQFWLDIISTSNDIKFLNNLLTIKSEYTSLYSLLNSKIFNLYWMRNYTKKNIINFDFSFRVPNQFDITGQPVYKTETEKYYEYLASVEEASKSANLNYDIDVTYKYCVNNFLDFTQYRDNILPYNPLFITIMLNMLYGPNDLLFSFWKKYNILNNNVINTTVPNNDHNFINEWRENMNKFVSRYLDDINLKNPIYESLINSYLTTEQYIYNTFNTLKITDPTNFYIRLKVYFDRFYEIPNYQLNFNDHYMVTKYTDTLVDLLYKNDNYNYLKQKGVENYPTLINNFDYLSTDERSNLTPIDLQNTFALIADDILELEFSISDLSLANKSFLILWRNSVVNRLYKRYLDINTYVKNNGELFDYSGNRKLSLYYSIYPSNLYFFDDFKNSFYEMFYKNSWIGSVSLEYNSFQKFKENAFDVEKINLFSTDYEVLGNDNKNFNELNITNTYDFVYYNSISPIDNYNKYNMKKVIYDSTNKTLLVKLNNYIDKNCKLGLSINGVSTTYSSFGFKHSSNEKNFNSLYVVLNNLNITPENPIVNGTKISISISYTNYLPTINFYRSGISYPKLITNKYYLLTKFSDNELDIFNIIDNKVLIDTSIIKTNLINVLVINYLNNQKIVPPVSFNYTVGQSNGSKNVTPGKHLYSISFYNLNGESSITQPIVISVGTNTIVQLTDIPVSKDPSVLGRKIYRSRVNDNKLYLLATMDNTLTQFLDNYSDNELGIEYIIDNNTKYNYLPDIKETTTKTIITIEPHGDLFRLLDLNGNEYILPTKFEDIKEIYIEQLDINYNILPPDTFTIANNGTLKLLDYTNNFFINQNYYLVNPNNFKDNVKIVPSKGPTPFENVPKFTILPLSVSEPITQKNYIYRIAFYNTVTEIRSNNVVEKILVINSDQYARISDLPPIYNSDYNGWIIYRTKNNDNTFYLLDVILNTGNNIYDDTKDDNALTQVFTGPTLYNRATFTIETTTGNNTLDSGTYLYRVAFYNSTTNTESLPMEDVKVTVNSNHYVIINNFPPIYDSSYNGWIIYRTKNIMNSGVYSNYDNFYLVAIVNSSITNIYNDYKKDNQLTEEYQNPYFYITNPINQHLINKPTTQPVVSRFSSGSIPSGTYKYCITFFDDNTGEESLPSPVSEINISEMSKVSVTIPSSLETRVTSRIIYRTENNGTLFRYLTKIYDNVTSPFIDNILDENLSNYLQTNNNIPRPQTKPILEISSTNLADKLIPGEYKYVYSYFNNNTKEETYVSPSSSIMVYTNSKIRVNVLKSDDSNVTHIHIYRTAVNSTSYRYLTQVSNINTSFEDNTDDQVLYMNPVTQVDTNIQKINTLPTLELLSIPSMNVPGTYTYRISYYSSALNEESLASPESTITTTMLQNTVRITLPISGDPRVTSRRIYKKATNSGYKLLKEVNNNTDTFYLDQIDITSISKEPITGNVLKLNRTEYRLLRVPVNGITPNLNQFISHSTDFNFINDKKMSDLNDYLFNKPFIMLINNTTTNVNSLFTLKDSFNTSNVYFYNIGFKIDRSSVIKLNGTTVNYLIPITSQQFFAKEEPYYRLNLDVSTITPATDYQVIQKRFNPSFEEFNLSYRFLNSNYYSDIFIDSMVDKLVYLLELNENYRNITNMIDDINSQYCNTFINLLKITNTELYGQTSLLILGSYLDTLNKLNNVFNDKMAVLNVTNYLNLDYFKFSHYALKLNTNDDIQTDTSLINFNTSIRDITILSPVYEHYNANNKLSDNLKQYLIDVSNFFRDHIQYVKNNQDYLNISNPNNYIEDFKSYQEIQQHKNDNFYDYHNTNTLELMHPIIDSNIYKINVTDENSTTTITNFTVNNNQIITTEYNKNLKQDEYNDTAIKFENRNEYLPNKFNYMGIVSLDNSHRFIFNDTYIPTGFSVQDGFFIKLDDDKFYFAFPVEQYGRYYINNDVGYCQVINPYKVLFDPNSFTPQPLVFIGNKHIYKITVEFTQNTTIITNGMVLMSLNGEFVVGYHVYDSGRPKNGVFYFVVDRLLDFNESSIAYQIIGDTNWNMTPKVKKYTVNSYKQANYRSAFGVVTGQAYIYKETLYSLGDSYIINIGSVLDGNYFMIDSQEPYIGIGVYSNMYMQLLPSCIIRGGLIYSYYEEYNFSRELRDTDDRNYVFLFDLTKDRYFILRIKDIIDKQIPQGNYHCWLIPRTDLQTIPYVCDIDIDSNGNLSNMNSNPNLPTYSFYLISNNFDSCVYYYEKGDTVTVSDPNIKYYYIKNLNVKQIYLLDNDAISTQMKQLLKLYKSKTCSEHFINKELIKNSTETKFYFDSSEYLCYKSEFINKIYNLNSYNDSIVGLGGEREVIVSMVLKDKNTPIRIFHPIIIKSYQPYSVKNITFTYNSITYNKSFVVVNSLTIAPYLTGSTLNADYVVGNIIGSDTYTSLSPELSIDENNNVIIKKGYTIKNKSFDISLWKVQGKTSGNNVFYMYFWILFSENDFINNIYLKLLNNINTNSGVAEPLYINQDGSLTISNYCSEFNLEGCSPDILEQSEYDLILKTDTMTEKEVAYRYYSDTRHIDTTDNHHLIKQFDFNQKLNIKPYIELGVNSFQGRSILDLVERFENNKGIVFILYWVSKATKQKKMTVYLIIEFYEMAALVESSFESDSDIQFLSISSTIGYPFFIPNSISINKVSDEKYEITQYNKLFLEQGEVIILDGNYFYVDGLNVYTDNYELTLIRKGRQLRYNYSGYYTVGNYLRKDNNKIPDISYQNIVNFKKSTEIQIGQIYYDNNNQSLKISKTKNKSTNESIFKESELKVKLYYSHGRLYLFDNFIKIKKLDILIYNNISYVVKNIRDCEVFLDKIISLSDDDTFIECTLPYQPFEIEYMNIDINGMILSDNFSFDITVINEIIANSGEPKINPISNQTPEGTYIIYNHNLLGDILYQFTNNEWVLIAKGVYKIKSDIVHYHDSYITVGSDGSLNKFNIITANVEPINTPGVNGEYRIDNEILYYNNVGNWNIVSTGIYYVNVNSNDSKYKERLITPRSNNTLHIINNYKYAVKNEQAYSSLYQNNETIVSELVDILTITVDGVTTYGSYKIEFDKLYIYTIAGWVPVISGVYFIISTDSYNGKHVNVESDGSLTIFSNIVVKNYTEQLANDDYILYNNKLYIYESPSLWKLVTGGYYYGIQSQGQPNTSYDNKLFVIKPNGLIHIVDKNLFTIKNSSLVLNPFSGVGYRLVRVWKTNYVSYFDNKFTVPVTLVPTNLKFNDNFSIELFTQYDYNKKSLKVLNHSDIFEKFNFYYLQPVYLCGSYNYVKSIVTNTEDNVTAYYIYLINEITIDSQFDNSIIKIAFTPSYCNEYDYFSQLRIRFNSALQPFDYNELYDYTNNVGKKIEVIRFAFKDDNLVFFERLHDNQKIIFEYGKPIEENEANNNITGDYDNVYFYNYKSLNSDGRISNHDTLIGSYHLLLEEATDFHRVHILKIVYPNKYKIYTDIIPTFYTFYLGRVIPLIVNKNNDFMYIGLKVNQSKKLLDVNKRRVDIIKQYDIRLRDLPIIVSNNYKQEFVFINNDSIDYNIYNTISIDESGLQEYKLEYSSGKYYIVSDTYLSNDITKIYTRNINWLDKATFETVTKKNKDLSDPKNELYINSRVLDTEFITFNINLSKINAESLLYQYSIIDKTTNFVLNDNENYKIYRVYQDIDSINNTSSTLVLNEPIDNDTLEISREHVPVNSWVVNQVNTNNIFNPINLFTNVKQLRGNLLSNSVIDSVYLFSYLKPWKYWSLLNSINKVPTLEELVNKVYCVWDGTTVINQNMKPIEIVANQDIINPGANIMWIDKSDNNKLKQGLSNFTGLVKVSTNFVHDNMGSNIWISENTYFVVNGNIVVSLVNIITVYAYKDQILNNIVPPEYWIDKNTHKLMYNSELYTGYVKVYTDSIDKPEGGVNWVNGQIYVVVDGIPIIGPNYIISANESDQSSSNFWIDTNMGNDIYKLKYNNYLFTGNITILTDSINRVSILTWINNKNFEVYDGVPVFGFDYLTNEELAHLRLFLETISKDNVAKQNFITMRDIIEPAIINGLSNWLSNPSFFMNVKESINSFLYYSGFNVTFNGVNIIFNDDPDPEVMIIDGVPEIISYITDEFTYDTTSNKVYRSHESYREIDNQVNNWINKVKTRNMIRNKFGVSVHKLCRYLVQLGNDIQELYAYIAKPSNSIPEYVYNNPLKFIINKLWEKYKESEYLSKLDTRFADELRLIFNFQMEQIIYSGINYMQDFSVTYNGVYSTSYFDTLLYDPTIEYSIDKLSSYKPNIIKPEDKKVALTSKPLYPYVISFQTNEITTNTNYSIDFINGTRISADLDIDSPIIYPDQLNFYSTYNILPSDYIVVKQNNTYSVTDTRFLGYSYNLKFNISISELEYIDKVYYRNYNVIIVSKFVNNNIPQVNGLIPMTCEELKSLGEISTQDIFELRNNIGIVDTISSNSKQYLTFYNNSFIFRVNSTLLKASDKIYPLKQDMNGYYIESGILDNYSDVEVITYIKLVEITPNDIINEVIYQYEVNPPYNETKYRPENDNLIIPLEFKLIDSNNTNNYLVPTIINTLGDSKLVFHFTRLDNETITNYGVTDTTKIVNFNKITQDKRLGQEITNKILEVNIDNVDEYLYCFNFILPRSLSGTTTIFIYDMLADDILIENGIYEPINDKVNKTSIYVDQEDIRTLFTVTKKYNTNYVLENIGFIQRNQWTIESNNYYQDINKLTVKVPNDFILNTDSAYYYKINDTVIDTSTFIFTADGYLSFTFTDLVGGNILFKQYYIEEKVGVVQVPPTNRKYKITIDYPYQYKSTDSFYIVPYSGYGGEFNNSLYKIKTNISTNKNGFIEAYTNVSYPNGIIYLYSEGIKYTGKIFDELHENGLIYYIVSFNEILDTTKVYTYNLEDNITRYVYDISFYQESLQFCKYYKQDELGSIYLFISDTINKYICSEPISNPRPNKFYMVSYIGYEVVNIFNENKFVQSDRMKKNTRVQYTRTTTIEKPEWETFEKMFEYIKFYFNDQLMEEINEDVFSCNYYLYATEEKKRQIINISKVRKVLSESKWELYIPLCFWFSNKPGLSIPTVALPYTELRLVYKLNDIKHVLKNDLDVSYSFSKEPEVRINLISDFILLDTIERKLFGSFSHEYIIDRFRVYPNNYINSETITIPKKFSGLVKDIHMITKLSKNKKIHSHQNIVNKYDVRYQRYVNAVKYYNKYISDNYIYSSDEQKEYTLDIEIIKNNLHEYNDYISSGNKDSFTRITRIINNFSGFNIWDKNDNLLKFLMYYEDRFIPTLPESRKTYVMTMYLKYQYSNKQIIEEISPIESLTLKVNGGDLFSERDWVYFTYAIPNQKFKNTLPMGHYTYTFSLYPQENQHSGHLNFTNFDDITLKVKSNSMVVNDPVILCTVIKEYNVLRIMSGLGSVAWIN